MDTQLGVVAATDPSPDMMWYQQRMQTHAAGEFPTARSSLPKGVMAIEACRLIEDVRRALNWDLGDASKAAGRLAALLASKLQRESRSAPARGGLAPWQKREVRNYIEDRLGGSVLIRDLAKLVSLSPSHFSRAFKESFGDSPHSYIIRKRVERAQTLMLSTSSSLSQIAFACGLVDQAHLCRCFRQATGTTPGVWRHSHTMDAPSEGIVERIQPSSWNVSTSLGT